MARATPEFNSNETNKHKISRIAIQILLKFSASVARTSSVARVGVGKGAGAPRNSERRPLTNIAHNTPKR